MSDIAIQHTCSDDTATVATPQGDAETCYNLFVAKLPATVPEDENLDLQNYVLYLAARDAGEQAQEDTDWPAGYSIETNTATFSRQNGNYWDDTVPGCQLALRNGSTLLYYFGVETLS